MTCHYIPDVKTLQILSLHFVSTLQSAVCILYPVCNCCLHFVLTGIRGTNTVYFWLQLFAQHTQSTTEYLCVSYFDIFVHFRVNTLFSCNKNVDITYNVQVIHLPQKNNSCMHSMPIFIFQSQKHSCAFGIKHLTFN